MPVVNDTPNTAPVERPHTPVITAPEYKGVTVDLDYVSATNLLTHVEGSSWTVNYYSQVLGEDSALSGQNTNRDPVHQQYTLVKGMELKVTSALTVTQDETTKTMLVRGVANVYPFIIPNEGDMFLAGLNDGREGVFKVTVTDRKSLFRDAVHEIEYQLIDFSTDTRRGDLNSKVIKTLQFVGDFLQHGQNPLLQEDVFGNLKRLEERYQEILERYFKLFNSNEYKTLLVPGQSTPIYDPFLTSAVKAFFSTDECFDLRNIRILNVDGDIAMKSTQIWDVLLHCDISRLKFCFRQAGLVSAKTFERMPMMEGIYHSGVKFVVYPKDPELNVDYEIAPRVKSLADEVLVDTPSQVRRLADLLGDKTFEGLTRPDAPPIHRVCVDEYYVLSQAFYDEVDIGQSQLEMCVRDYLNHKALDVSVILNLCNTYHAWGGLERFYYTPILLLLCRAAIRGI